MFYIFTTPSLRGLSLSISLSKNEQRSRAAQLKVLLHLQRIPSALFVFFFFLLFSAIPSISGKRPTRLIQCRRLATPTLVATIRSDELH